MIRGLLAGIAAIFGAVGDEVTRKRRQASAPTAIDKAHARAADRKRALDRLNALEGYGYILTPEERAALRTLRLTRGKLARRMGRRRAYGISKTVRAIKAGRQLPASAPLRLGNRIPRAARVMLLAEEKRPLSGRQWKRLRKAARRQERAA